MITIIISAIKGPMLSALSGCLGESGLGNDSYFRNIFDVDIPKGLPSNRETSLLKIGRASCRERVSPRV